MPIVRTIKVHESETVEICWTRTNGEQLAERRTVPPVAVWAARRWTDSGQPDRRRGERRKPQVGDRGFGERRVAERRQDG